MVLPIQTNERLIPEYRNRLNFSGDALEVELLPDHQDARKAPSSTRVSFRLAFSSSWHITAVRFQEGLG